MLNMRPQKLVVICPFSAVIAPDCMFSGNGEILKLTFAPFITDRAIVRVVDHQPFDNRTTERHSFGVSGRNNHTILGRKHAGHLDTLDRPFQHFYRADPAGSRHAKRRMPAEMRNNNADSCRRLQDICPVYHFYCDVVYDQFRHGNLCTIKIKKLGTRYHREKQEKTDLSLNTSYLICFYPHVPLFPCSIVFLVF